MSVSMKKVDGTYSLTMIWNVVVIFLTAIFGVAVAMLPDIEKVISPEVYVAIALAIKGVDVGLRQITTMPVKGK